MNKTPTNKSIQEVSLLARSPFEISTTKARPTIFDEELLSQNMSYFVKTPMAPSSISKKLTIEDVMGVIPFGKL